MANIPFTHLNITDGTSQVNKTNMQTLFDALRKVVAKANRGATEYLDADLVAGVTPSATGLAALAAGVNTTVANFKAAKAVDADTVEGVDIVVPRANVKTPWALPTLFNPDPLRASVEAATGGRVTVLYDDQGNPSYMHIVPKFNVEDIHADFGTGVHPAFIVGGVEKPYIMVGQVVASAGAGSRAVSIPGRDPWCSVTFDVAKAACVNKGSGWHMMTNWEWAALVLWCLKNGYQPRGNTNYGRAHDALHETAPRQDGLAPGGTSGTARNGGGLGPASWRHDGSPIGIADLVGNVWEWQDGFKLVDGRIYMPADNNYALAEGSWPATDAYMINDGGVLKMGAAAGIVDASISTTWRTGAYVAGYDSLAVATRRQMMQALITSRLTHGATAPFTALGTWYANTSGERFPIRGGSWVSGSLAGVAALSLYYLRSLSNSTIGFRPAFVP
jgi:sulfatase modifying factor 1